uniref:heavy metal-associated isoprenylated plant protein 34-like n=1 Tax=Erigeron canadensis TaxID=72917 RepID=UPI001CB8E1CE|nr:heavy metal-associated isoprenylated plant protein 34-like [Erigeron canadensis]
MNKQDFMKLQTCVLRVNIQCACDGCKQKIKKLLNKVDGVYKTSIDLDQGKVTVSGNADPAALIKKLNKAGKHAELWGPQKGGNVLNNQFKNMVLDNKGKKGGGGGGGGGGGKDKQKDGKGNQPIQIPISGFKDLKLPNKDQKQVKFNIPIGGGGHGGGGFDDEDDFYDDDSFDDDEFDDEYDDEDDDSFDEYEKKPNKMMAGPGVGGHGPHGPIAMMNGNGKKGPGAGFELPGQFKGMAGKNDAKNGKDSKKGGGESGKKGKDGKSGGGGGFGAFFGSKIGGALLGGGKKKQSASSPKGGKKGDKKGDKGGKHHDEGKFNGGGKQSEFLEFSKPQNGGGGKNKGQNGSGGKNTGQNGGGGGARNIGQMGGNPMMPQMGNYSMGQMGGYPMGQMPSAQGLPMGYRPQGMEHGGNPYQQQQQFQQQQYQQQQYMQAMLMNQQRANMYHPQMLYGGQPPHGAYGPPMGQHGAYGPPMGAPANDNMTHIFSDENTDSCSIM